MTTPSRSAIEAAKRLMQFYVDGGDESDDLRLRIIAEHFDAYAHAQARQAVSDFAELHKIENELTRDLMRYDRRQLAPDPRGPDWDLSRKDDDDADH